MLAAGERSIAAVIEEHAQAAGRRAGRTVLVVWALLMAAFASWVYFGQ
jgi:hypothetical protein